MRKGEDPHPDQLSLFHPDDEWIKTELRQIPIDTMSPIEAINKLYELKKRVEEEC